ncbi:hypothetical protein ACQ4PT_058149 [Festuca glaucescens]
MARISALLLALVLFWVAASATSEKSTCCRDYHLWGNELENVGCPVPEKTEDCNAWCQQSACARDNISKNGFCKKIGKLHYCHCKC